MLNCWENKLNEIISHHGLFPRRQICHCVLILDCPKELIFYVYVYDVNTCVYERYVC